MSQKEAKAGKRGEEKIEKGLKNMEKHLENLALFGVPVVVAINRFPNDAEDEIEIIEKFCNERGVAVAVSEVWSEGGEGGIELAGKVIDTIYNKKPSFKYLYSLDMSVKEKIETIARKIYGAGKIVYTVAAEDDIRIIKKLDMEDLLVCMAKTPYSLSDDPQLKGRPENFKITIKQIRISAGAGFIVPITGKITTMPGLPAHPAAEKMDIINGMAEGLF